MKKKIQKPFDVEAAKNGAKVETRDGEPVRILCYDRVDINYPIIALINCQNIELCHTYTSKGEIRYGKITDRDLVIIEEVEVSKFNVGDWIFRGSPGASPLLIVAITSDCYMLQDLQGNKVEISQIAIDRFYRLWTLDDARPGDVLVCEDGDRPFIFKGCIDGAHPGYPTAYCGINCSGEFTSNAGQTWWTDSSVKPATSNEKDMLFKKMEEEGYKWDAESLTVSKIQKRWRDNEYKTISGYYMYTDSRIIYSEGHSNIKENYNLFATEKQAKSALAMAQISQIMANDERFGGVVTDEEWNDGRWHIISRLDNKLVINNKFSYEFLAFHNYEQAELFLKENEDLIKDYYMLD